MKKLLFLSIAVLGLQSVNAQSNSVATSTMVEAGDYNINAVTIEFPISEKEMEEVFEKKIRNAGAGKKTSKWSVSRKYRYYPGSSVGEISTDKLDYYYRIDGNNSSSSVTVFASHGYDNFVKENEERETFENMKTFLESINEDVNAVNWQHRLEEQEEVVKDHEKEVSNSESDLAQREDALSKLQKEIEDNKADIENKKAELQKQKDLLETIRSERQ